MTTKLKSVILRQHEILHAIEHKGGQFRRVVKPQPDGETPRLCPHAPIRDKPSVWLGMTGGQWFKASGVAVTPPNWIGDRVWVRETFSCATDGETLSCPVTYRADGPFSDDELPPTWRPSTQMPLWASRLTLKITAVRVERVQDISEADAIAEGIESSMDDRVRYFGPYGKGHACPKLAFSNLWDSHAKPGERWAGNPFVWVGEYKVINAETGETS